jgi:hypothetical protein
MSGLPLARYLELSRDLSLKLTPEDHAAANGFLHFCSDWDGLLIDQTAPEFDCCSCCFSDDYDPKTGKLSAKVQS